MAPHLEVAVAFASALVEGDFDRAQFFLAPSLRKQFTPAGLRDQLYAMFERYAEGNPRSIHFDARFALEDWPGKLPGDIGQAYVSINGDDFVEAVNVIVAEINHELLIRDIQWARP